MDFVHAHVQKGGKHRRVTARPDRAPFEIAKAQVSRNAAPARDGLDSAIKKIDQLFGILPVRVATHGWLVHRNLAAACLDEVLQFGAHRWQQGFSKGIAIRVVRIRYQAPAQCIRTGDAGLERRPRRRQPLEPLEIFHCAQPPRRRESSDHLMLAALVMRWRTEPAR